MKWIKIEEITQVVVDFKYTVYLKVQKELNKVIFNL